MALLLRGDTTSLCRSARGPQRREHCRGAGCAAEVWRAIGMSQNLAENILQVGTVSF